MGFEVADQRYALPLAAVERVLPMVAVTPLPQAPAVITGVIDVHGRIVPVADTRRRLGLPERAPQLSDRLILARTGRRLLALTADAVQGVLAAGAEIVATRDVLPALPHIAGVARCADGLILIHDLGRFLSLEEEQSLERALASS